MLLCGGSSPLARGLPGTITPEQYEERIIPARAGFTQQPAQEGDRPEDHPRSRGVYSTSAASWALVVGSSPLARGLLVVRDDQNRVAGIIPARAGFTSSPGPARTPMPDHPRSRGVYGSPSTSPSTPTGSSPLARGLRGRADGGGVGLGIIPARAGFTPSVRVQACPSSDHPRSRGVYYLKLSYDIGKFGSSPLARGLRTSSAD